MKALILVALVFFSLPSIAQDDTSQLEWLTDLDEAMEISKNNNQPILVYFTGSDWCAPCKSLKTDFFDTEEFAARAENLVLVMIDYPRRVDIITEKQRTYNRSIIGQYNTEKSFPTLVMLDKKGTEIGKLSGYSAYGADTSHQFRLVDDALLKYN